MGKRFLVASGLFALVLSLSSCGGYSQGEAVIAIHNFLKNARYVEGTYAGKDNGKDKIRVSYGKAAGTIREFPANEVLPDEKGAGIVMQRKRLNALIEQNLFTTKGHTSMALAPDAISPEKIKIVSKYAQDLSINGWVMIMKAYSNCKAFDHQIKHSNLNNPVRLINDNLMDKQLPLFRKLAKKFKAAGVAPSDDSFKAVNASSQCDGEIFKALGKQFDEKHPNAWFKKLMKTQDAYRSYLIALTSLYPNLKQDSRIGDVVASNGTQYADKRFSSGLLAQNIAKEINVWYKAGNRTMTQYTKEEDKLVSMVPSANKAALVQGIDFYMHGSMLQMKAKQAKVANQRIRG